MAFLHTAQGIRGCQVLDQRVGLALRGETPTSFKSEDKPPPATCWLALRTTNLASDT